MCRERHEATPTVLLAEPTLCFSPDQAQESVGKKEEVASWQEERKVSKYAANLEQLPCDRKIPMDPAQV